MRTVHFYFDFVSPYAYLASRRIEAVLLGLELQIEPVPVLFAALLDHHGHKGPAEIPTKREHMFKDVVRKAARYALPFRLPCTHPFKPLLALRTSAAVEEPGQRLRLAKELFACAFERGEQLEDQEVVAGAILRSGLSIELLDAARNETIKQRLRDNTKAALRRGVFGVPSFALEDELFWGSDVLEDLALYAAGKDPVPSDFFRKLVQVRPSATRKQ